MAKHSHRREQAEPHPGSVGSEGGTYECVWVLSEGARAMPKSGTLQKLGGKKKEDWQEVAVTLDERGLAWESQGAGGALSVDGPPHDAQRHGHRPARVLPRRPHARYDALRERHPGRRARHLQRGSVDRPRVRVPDLQPIHRGVHAFHSARKREREDVAVVRGVPPRGGAAGGVRGVPAARRCRRGAPGGRRRRAHLGLTELPLPLLEPHLGTESRLVSTSRGM